MAKRHYVKKALTLVVNAFVGLTLSSALCDSLVAEDRYDAHHADAGLPIEDRPLLVYSPQIDHPLNELHRLLFIAQVAPVEIGGSLPRELLAETDISKPWYFRKREGSESDRRLFGGDVRISPVVDWNSEQTKSLDRIAERIDADQCLAALPAVQRLLLQWDLLSVWWRLEKTKNVEPAAKLKLAQLIHQCAQSKEAIERLPTGWREAQDQFANVIDESKPYFSPENILEDRNTWTEVSRSSSQLFVAPQSLRSSRVFIKTKDPRIFEHWTKLNGTANERPDANFDGRIETAMVLNLIAITPELEAIASPLIDEIRFRVVFDKNEDISHQDTTTQDGSSIWVYFVDRQQSLEREQLVYRNVPMTTQSIFLEYGSAKHSTFAAQCSLCHRISNSGNQTVAGIRSLSLSAKPKIESDPTYRARLAVAQMKVVTDRLRERLDKGGVELPVPNVDFRQISKIQPSE